MNKQKKMDASQETSNEMRLEIDALRKDNIILTEIVSDLRVQIRDMQAEEREIRADLRELREQLRELRDVRPEYDTTRESTRSCAPNSPERHFEPPVVHGIYNMRQPSITIDRLASVCTVNEKSVSDIRSVGLAHAIVNVLVTAVIPMMNSVSGGAPIACNKKKGSFLVFDGVWHDMSEGDMINLLKAIKRRIREVWVRMFEEEKVQMEENSMRINSEICTNLETDRKVVQTIRQRLWERIS